MCLNCGCGMPNDDMGNPQNITIKTLAKAAKASGMNSKDTIKNLKKALENLKKEELEEEIEKSKD